MTPAFRFIPLGLLAAMLLVQPAGAEERYQILFNGKDFSGWEGQDGLWSIVGGTIVGQTTAENPTKGNTFLIWDGEVKDFDFRCKVKFSGNNSGVQYRSQVVDAAKHVMAGYQADLHPRQDYFGMLYGEKLKGRGIIATRGQQVIVPAAGKPEVTGKVGDKTELTDDEWNELRIVAVGNRLIHQVNGVTTVDITDNHPNAALSGKLGLQLHAGPPMKVEFRNLLLRKLAGDEAQQVLEAAIASGKGNSDDTADASGVEEPRAAKGKNWLRRGTQAEWIWTPESKNNQKLWFRKTFELSAKPKYARVYATCDNHAVLKINGKNVGTAKDWMFPLEKDVKGLLVAGQNVITAECRNAGGVAAFVLKLDTELEDATEAAIVTDKSWRMSSQVAPGWERQGFDDSAWALAATRGKLGISPWGIPNYDGNSRGGPTNPLDPNRIMTAPGFVVDHLYTVPKSTQGSWVSLTVGPDGRFYASDQGGEGLFRITVAADGNTTVEPMQAGSVANVSAAQGLLWAFDSLWVHRNGGNLYRLTDSDGDGNLDNAEKYPGTTGGGEHGNHAVIVTEDGEGIYMCSGNASNLAECEKRRVQSWQEDLLLDRMWDARGHARGRLAPGGWVTRLNPQTKQQEVYCIGFRNQYDIALNRHGDMFTYDADMEWDMGAPWYRPTRICHVISGGDYGWRSGSGKWPTYYEDSLPPTAEIGPGSPTGVIAGLGSAFPTRYQDAIFALDWTFGTIYVTHLTPDGAGYRGQAEPFVYGSPLPVTDAVIGHDGGLYFTIGGRGSQSALFRVRYIGDESTAEPTEVNEANVKARATRRMLEAFHGVEDKQAIDAAWPYLGSQDRWLRHAARVAIESQPVDSWAERAVLDPDPQTRITASVALARSGTEKHRRAILGGLMELQPANLPEGQLLGLLRAHALNIVRLGYPSRKERIQLLAQLEPLLPHESSRVNSELIRVLVALKSPVVVAKTMALIEGRGESEIPDWSELASRNKGYGGTVQGMLDNYPPLPALDYAFKLRQVKQGWTIDQRRAYFTFLNEAAKASGGASYSGFLTRIRDEALGNCNDVERKALEDITGEDFNPVPEFAIVEPKGPGQKWTIATASSALRGKANFERGRSLYFGLTCGKCHRFDGLGGNIGPDLTSVPNKFDQNYLLEAIIEPSKHISDQYGSSVVVLFDGRVITGLVIENGDSVEIYPNEAEPDAPPIKVAADDIDQMTPSPTSQMPVGLLDKCSIEEIRDLVAYIMAGGNPDDKRYKK